MKIIKAFIKRPILIAIALILIVFLPLGLSASPESIDLLHAVSLGIDKHEDGLEISIMAFVATSKETFVENYFLITAKAPSVAEAMKLISINVGKRLMTIHIGVIVISQEIATEGVLDSLNYFYRSSAIVNDTFLMCSTSTAKEVIENEIKLINASGINLEEIGLYNENHIFVYETNIEAFYCGYFSETKAALVPLVELKTEAEATQTTSKGTEPDDGGQNGGASSGGSEEQKYIQNTGKSAIFYDGLLKTIMNEDEMRGINWIGNSTKDVNIRIDNVTDENFENASLFFAVEGNDVKLNTYFNYNNKPVLEITTKIYLNIEQVMQENLKGIEKNISDAKDYLTNEVRNKLEYQIKKEFCVGLQKLIENQADILSIYKSFDCQNHFKFQEWYKKLEEPKEFLRELDYRLTVRVKATD